MAEGAAITGFQLVGAYEARQLARAEQRRAQTAKATVVVLKGLHANVNRLDHSIEHHERELTTTRVKVSDGDFREHCSEFSSRTYWLIIALLLLMEVPFNKAALDFLRRPEIESLGIALFVSAVTALVAKFTGRVLRQRAWRDRAFREWGLALAFNLAFALAVWKVAELRGQLLHNSSAGMTVLALQVVGYAAMVGFTFLHIDPDVAREQLTRLIAVQEQRLHCLWRERCRMADEYNKALAEAQLALAEIEHDAVERVMEYRDHNMRCRSEAAPDFFRRSVTRALFHPINLGTPLDAHPRQIGDVIRRTPYKEDEHD